MNDAFEGKAEGQRKTGYRGLAEVGGHRQLVDELQKRFSFRAERGQCGMFMGIGIILALRSAMIQHEPAMTRKTISRPKARARILLV